MKIERKPSTALLPAPVVLVTVADDEGKANVLTIACTTRSSWTREAA